MRYGISYKGSKNTIAKHIVDALPPAEHFYDVFAGGCAITHAAMLSGKYKYFHVNDIGKTPQLFADAIAGKYKNETRWISREDFFALKDTDEYVRIIWSFGNNGKGYLFGKHIEPFKKALHYALMFGDYSLIEAWGVSVPKFENRFEWRAWISDEKNAKEVKEKYVKWFVKNVLHLTEKEADLILLEGAHKTTADELREYLRDALNKSGLTQSEIDRRLGTNGMSRHYFGKSQWEFPTLEVYQKLQQWLDLPRNYFECVNPMYNILEQLEQLQQLQQLQRLQRLERLQQTQFLTITQKDYRDLSFEKDSVIYCDPPYINTSQYVCGDFDHSQFYEWALSQKNIFISEYTMPESFTSIWEKEKRVTMAMNRNDKSNLHKTENLFITRSNDFAKIKIGEQLEFNF